ncbi:Wax ester synthase-like Acyl-CoA acyltransferase domain-containing protein [Streptomyces sp. BpilaLS-43]|uniref:wax ester/triacylglycerol synthase domain-containing protein n=1 Tax=Streptomyces sp. BpilaLS-43 TaxID=1839778 RepID=UPI00081B122F|nr:wax ester/triacylglycerol synthase domain-containing protein [Streptomyces sp. BpilaLS-43]SCD99538.1 Wax ester synthase-like Acyl-CoA acyltransferase domain-containing protein [Streptomyces sp. BpilaLS-43]
MPVTPPSAPSVPAPRHPAHAVDRAFLSMERRHPDVRWDAGGVAYLSGPPPSLADLRTYLGLRLPHLPLLTSRVEGGSRRPRWRPDADFAVDRQVHEVVADGPEDWDAALNLALNAPFAPGAYWGVWLIHGHAADEYAVCYRFHHACQDGAAAAMTFRALLGEGEPSARPVPNQGRPAPLPRRVGTVLGLTAKFVAGSLVVRGARPAIPFEPTGERRLWRGRVPADTLRRIGAARGGSAHDVHLAALAGALPVWSECSGVPLPRVTALVPIDARRPDEEQTWGNRCFAVPLELPLGTGPGRADASEDGDAPLRRLDRVMARTRKLRGEAWRQAIQDMVRFMPNRPTEWYMRSMFSPRVTDVMATSMPLADKGSLGDTQVTGTALLPLLVPGHLFAVGLSFFGGWAEVSFVADRALPLGELLPELWEEAVGALAQTTPA